VDQHDYFRLVELLCVGGRLFLTREMHPAGAEPIVCRTVYTWGLLAPLTVAWGHRAPSFIVRSCMTPKSSTWTC
jgi:hypothetical protein